MTEKKTAKKKAAGNGHRPRRRTRRDLTKSTYAFLLERQRILRNFLIDAELEILVREKSDALEAAGAPNDLPDRLRRVCEEFVGEEAGDTVKHLVEKRLMGVARDIASDIRKAAAQS